MPATKVYVDEDVVIVGFADGTMKLYDRESRLFLSQLNVIPVAARGNADAATAPGTASSEIARAPTYLQHKISFLARKDEMVVSAMLDPSAHATSPRQLEISIWPLRALNAVQPLKNKLLPGTVHFVNFDRSDGLLVALGQYNPVGTGTSGSSSNHSHGSPHGGRAAGGAALPRDLPAHLAQIAISGPLVGWTWHPPFKSLMIDGLKWRESNDQQQAKLAQDVMEQVLLEASFFRAMFMVDADSEEVEHVVSSMFICLAGKDTHAAQFIETAIDAEIVLRRHVPANANTPSSHSSTASVPAANTSSHGGKDSSNNSASASPSGSNTASPEVSRASMSKRNGASTSATASTNTNNGSLKGSIDSSTNDSTLGHSSASLTNSKDGGSIGAHRDGMREPSNSVGGSSPSETSLAPPQYFPPNAMTTAVITTCLQEMCAPYLEAVLSKYLGTLSTKGSAAHIIFSLPSTHAAPEDQPMFHALIKITSGIIDGLIEHQSKLALPAHKMLVAIHQSVCADNPSDSELRSFRRGAARVFLDYVLLKSWLDPVAAGLVVRVSNEMRHNLRIVAQLLQVVCGYSKHKLTEPSLCSLVTEYSTKWRSWLLSKVSDPNIAPAARLPGLDRTLHDAKFDGRYDYESGIFGGSPKQKDRKDKDKRPKIGRGTSFIAPPKSGNAKAASMVVTKYIITHAAGLLEVMNRGKGRTPDPTAIRIRALADSLMMPIMTMMAKQGTKDLHLAASLRVFGKAGQGANGSLPSESSRSSGTASSSESVSSESYGNKDKDTIVSSAALQRSTTASPTLSPASANTPSKSRRRGSDRRTKRTNNSTSNSGGEDKLSKSIEHGEQDGSGSDRETSPRRPKRVVLPPTAGSLLVVTSAADKDRFGSSESYGADSNGNTSPSLSPHSPSSPSTQRSVSPRKTKKKKSAASPANPEDQGSSPTPTPAAASSLTSTTTRTRKATDGVPLKDDKNSSISRDAAVKHFHI